MNKISRTYTLKVVFVDKRDDSQIVVFEESEQFCSARDAVDYFRVCLYARAYQEKRSITERTLYRAICEKLFLRKNCAEVRDYDNHSEIIISF